MLAVTEAAAEAINSLVEAEGPDATGGLRFAVRSSAESEATLVVGLASEPQEGDQVVTSEGAQVYVDPEAVSFLDDKVLDVRPDGAGELNFALAEQG